MLRKFAAALLATAFIAGPAFAAQPSSNAGATPAPPSTAPAGAWSPRPPLRDERTKPVKTVKHVRKHARKHVVREPKKATT